jgi:hypothetical protein
VQTSAASEPSTPGAINLDWAGTTNTAAVVLDGLTEGTQTGCIHGTSWYVHQLGARLLLHAADPATKLADALAHALEDVAAQHRDTCDLHHPGSPCTTVTMVRHRGSSLDYLVLADSPLVIDAGDEPLVIIDETEKRFSAGLEHAARGGTPDDLFNLIRDQQQYRNTPGGYWVAQINPEAAEHAVTGTIKNARGALLLSDGAALLVTDFHELNWQGLLDLAYQSGPHELISATRKLESLDPDRTRWPRYKVSDDATAIIARL